jgi:hypothetical protein
MRRTSPINFDFTWRKRKYIKIGDDSKIKRQTNLDPHVPRLKVNIYHLSDPSCFSLQTNFIAGNIHKINSNLRGPNLNPNNL